MLKLWTCIVIGGGDFIVICVLFFDEKFGWVKDSSREGVMVVINSVFKEGFLRGILYIIGKMGNFRCIYDYR